MKIKAELIQASNNLATGVPIFTFRLTYPRKNWLLDAIGLSYRFEKWLTTSYYITSTDIRSLMGKARIEARREVHCALTDSVNDIETFVVKIFQATATAADGRPCGKVTAADVKKAIYLFGPRLQDVLKQYKPGEMHFGAGEGHTYMATESGWIKTGN